MLNLDSKKKYIIACSYGPDSMALLDMAIKDKLDVVVAHVNYHKRDISNFEEESLRKYCGNHNVQIEVLDTIKLKCEGNFQNWARKVRYQFFAEVLKNYSADAVLVAHQQDDLIETYLMQKQRGGFVRYSGIAEKTTIFGVPVIRPLLNFSKAELETYDKDCNVPFSIDISNLSNDYTRNKIRHEIVEKLSKDDRKKILSELASKQNTVGSYSEIIDLETFLDFSDEQITFFISDFVEENEKHIDISKKFVSEIRKAFSSKKTFVKIKLTNNLCIQKDFGFVELIDSRKQISYLYKLNQKDFVEDELFAISFKDGLDRNLAEADFPITIKPLSKKDIFELSDYSSEVRRLFIDWKMPHFLRDCWPGIYNKDGKLIYIPRYREKFIDNHKTKFVIKFSKPFQK